MVSIIDQNVMAPPGTPCLPTDAAPFWLALLALTVVSVVLVAGLGAALAGLFVLLDRLNRSPTPRGRR